MTFNDIIRKRAQERSEGLSKQKEFNKEQPKENLIAKRAEEKKQKELAEKYDIFAGAPEFFGEVGKGIVRGAGRTISEVAHESRQGPAEHSLPYLLGFGQEPVENYEWAENLKKSLPEESKIGPGRYAESMARMATDPRSLMFGPLGAIGGTIMGAGEQTMTELDVPEEAKNIIRGITASAGLFFGAKGAKTTPKKTVFEEIQNLPYNELVFIQEEYLPKFKENIQNELNTAMQEQQKINQQQKSNLIAKHQHELYLIEQENKASYQEYQQKLAEQQQELTQLEAEHNQNVQAIEQQNKHAIEQYNQELKQYENAISNQRQTLDTINQNVEEMTGGKPSKSPREKGLGLKDSITETSSDLRENIDKSYKESEKLNKKISDTHPVLLKKLKKELKDLSEIPHPSGPTASRIKAIIDIVKRLEKGKVSNQLLLDQAKELRYEVDYKYQHGSFRNQFQKIINLLDDAVEASAKKSGNPEAYEAQLKAKTEYRDWVDKFDNEQMLKYRKETDLEHGKLYESSLNADRYHILENALGKEHPQVQQLKNDIIKKELEPFYEKPQGKTIKELDGKLLELKDIITESESNYYKLLFNEAKNIAELELKPPKEPKLSKTPEKPAKLKNLPKIEEPKPKEISGKAVPIKTKEIVTPLVKELSKKLATTDLDVQSKLRNVEGLREIKQDVKKLKDSNTVMEKITYYALRDMINKGKIQHNIFKKNPTGKEYYDIFNERQNYEMLAELLSDDVATGLLDVLQKQGSKEVKKEAFTRFIKDKSSNPAVLAGLKILITLL